MPNERPALLSALLSADRGAATATAGQLDGVDPSLSNQVRST